MQINSNYGTDTNRGKKKKKETMRMCWNTGATEREEEKGHKGIDWCWKRAKIYQFLDFKQENLKIKWTSLSPNLWLSDLQSFWAGNMRCVRRSNVMQSLAFLAKWR